MLVDLAWRKTWQATIYAEDHLKHVVCLQAGNSLDKAAVERRSTGTHQNHVGLSMTAQSRSR